MLGASSLDCAVIKTHCRATALLEIFETRGEVVKSFTCVIVFHFRHSYGAT